MDEQKRKEYTRSKYYDCKCEICDSEFLARTKRYECPDCKTSNFEALVFTPPDRHSCIDCGAISNNYFRCPRCHVNRKSEWYGADLTHEVLL